ncbi:PLP-dependent aminotransferase family protein [Limnobacter sp.]|uniref:aminotransferase-like domain-containing protein n=1 Tax=Limnobacter sp. TaxID=2003368 RepID=UPI0035190873
MQAEARKYEQLALTLQGMIEKGQFLAGHKLPSIRKLSEQWGFSIDTVQKALHLLEDRGYVQPVAKSGNFVQLPAGQQANACSQAPNSLALDPPISPDMSDHISLLLNSCMRGDVAPFGVAFPAPALLPIASLRRSFSTVNRKQPNLLAQDSHVQPNQAALVLQLQRRFETMGMRLRKDELLVTDGCTEALSLALHALTKRNHVVAVESPGYYLLLQLIEAMGLRALEIPSSPETGMSLEALEIAVKKTKIAACIVCPTASNPTGSVMPDANRKRLLELAEKYDFPIVEDNVYADLYFERFRPKPLKSFRQSDRVIMCGSFSKSLSPALRLGYVAGGRYAPALLAHKRILSGSTNPLTQMAVAHYLDKGSFERHLCTLRQHFETQVMAMSALVLKHFPEGTRVSQPKGGFVLWVELPAHNDTAHVFQKAILKKTAFMPGHVFSASGLYKNCLRINCGHPVNEDTAVAVARLGGLFVA